MRKLGPMRRHHYVKLYNVLRILGPAMEEALTGEDQLVDRGDDVVYDSALAIIENVEKLKKHAKGKAYIAHRRPDPGKRRKP